MSGFTPNAAAFVRANARSPVVAGAAIGRGGQGATYRLRNGAVFTLTREECEQVEPIRWALP